MSTIRDIKQMPLPSDTTSAAMLGGSCSPPAASIHDNAADAEKVESSVREAGAGIAATPPPTKVAEPTPRTWRKRPSQKGRPRLKLAKHATPWTATPKPTATAEKTARKKKKREASNGVGESPAARRKLDLDGERRSTKSSSTRRCFSRAMLMDSLRSLANLVLGYDEPKDTPPASSANAQRCFGRAELVDNLRSLAKRHNLPDDVVVVAVDGGKNKNSKHRRKKKATLVDKLVLVPYNSKRDTTADESISMALVVHDESARTMQSYVPRWSSEELPNYAKAPAQLVLGIDAATVAVYDELMRREETCMGEDLDDIPGGPEWDQRRGDFEVRVDHFMENVRSIIGDRKFSKWEGSVVTSVVGTFLTQNVTDNMSSNAFMNIVAKFSSSKNGSNVAERSKLPLLTNGNEDSRHQNTPIGDAESGVPEPGDAGLAEEGKRNDKDLDELIASLRRGDLSNWDKDRIRKVLRDRFGDSTADKIFKDITSIKDTSHWNALVEEAYKNGYKKEIRTDTVDWEALLHAPFADIEECIKDRGQHCLITFRILAFLIRIKRDHGSIDLEWLKHVPRAKAKKYLLSINGLGAKSVDCIRLLSLRHRAFPVDTNVARIVTRLGWVKLQPLPSSQEFHMVDKYPVLTAIQTYLDPLTCKIIAAKLYELHCQQITFGKSICSKRRPNCGACPFTADCMYYKSLFGRAMLALPEYSQQHGTEQTNMDKEKRHVLIVRPSSEHMHQYQIEQSKSTEMHSSEPIIEMPPTPPREYPEAPSEQEDEDQCYFHNDMEDIVLDYDGEIDLRPMNPTANSSQTGPTHGKDLISINPQAGSTRMQKKYHLRTEYTAYVIPDGDNILDKFDLRVLGDRNPYLLIIRSFDEHNVKATILIPCRTANRGSFPLNGTYFQENEVFADHSSSRSPIEISRECVWNFKTCIVYFGTSIHSVTKGQTQQGIREFFNTGFICTREFDRSTRFPRVLCAQIHATNVNKEIGKKRFRPDSSLNPAEDSNRDGLQSN